MERKERTKISTEEKAARLAERARRRGESPVHETPAPRVAAIDTTPKREHLPELAPQPPAQHQESSSVDTDLTNAHASVSQKEMNELKEQLQQQQRLIQLMMQKRREETAVHPPAPTGFHTPNQPKPKDTENARLVAMTAKKDDAKPATPTMESFLDALTQSLTTATTKSSISEPAKWNGKDAGYGKWWKSFRAYAKDKKWLPTLEDPLGPGTPSNPNPNFDHDINTAIYNKLQHLTGDGKASTWISRAPEFNGWAAAQELVTRYGGHTRQQVSTLKNTLRTMKHVKGTSMPNHIDDFEAVVQNLEACGNIPDDDEKSQ